MSTSAIRRKKKSSRHRSLYTPQGWSKSVLSNDQVGVTTVTRKGPNPHNPHAAKTKKPSMIGSLLASIPGIFRRNGSRGAT